jgi:hypothetical protein
MILYPLSDYAECGGTLDNSINHLGLKSKDYFKRINWINFKGEKVLGYIIFQLLPTGDSIALRHVLQLLLNGKQEMAKN